VAAGGGDTLTSAEIVARSGRQLAENERPDLEALVPATAEAVLDVGCGSGLLGERLKRRGVRRVVGLELNPVAAERAKAILDEVLVCDVEAVDVPFADASFDCLVYGDILEHLIDPWAVLRRHRRLLKPDGLAIISVPNIAYWRVLADLARGRWRYQPSGTLDRTHLRFFTLEGIAELCRHAQLRMEHVHTTITPGRKSDLLNRVSLGRLEHLLVWRYVVEARPD
jgi:2-polyprenyl-3-methyl-5-hydroxy-6-metoxy-1,4-benzoquinol methylase